MSALQTARIGSSIANALGLPVDTRGKQPNGEPERLYEMTIIGRPFFLKTRSYTIGETVKLPEDLARELFGKGFAVAVNPTEFEPLLSMPKPTESPMADYGSVPFVPVIVKKDNVANWASRIWEKGDKLRIPESLACQWLNHGVAAIPKDASLSARGLKYLASLKRGITSEAY